MPEVQALLRALATGRDVAELGTAFGEGAAAMETAQSVVTVERDHERAEAARAPLALFANVELLEGDCYELLRGRGPFGLVFADGGRPLDWEAILALLAPGGILVKDDLTPGARLDGDSVREFLLRDPRLVATEILTTPRTAVIVAVRR